MKKLLFLSIFILGSFVVSNAQPPLPPHPPVAFHHPHHLPPHPPLPPHPHRHVRVVHRHHHVVHHYHHHVVRHYRRY